MKRVVKWTILLLSTGFALQWMLTLMTLESMRKRDPYSEIVEL